MLRDHRQLKVCHVRAARCRLPRGLGHSHVRAFMTTVCRYCEQSLVSDVRLHLFVECPVALADAREQIRASLVSSVAPHGVDTPPYHPMTIEGSYGNIILSHPSEVTAEVVEQVAQVQHIHQFQFVVGHHDQGDSSTQHVHQGHADNANDGFHFQNNDSNNSGNTNLRISSGEQSRATEPTTPNVVIRHPSISNASAYSVMVGAEVAQGEGNASEAEKSLDAEFIDAIQKAAKKCKLSSEDIEAVERRFLSAGVLSLAALKALDKDTVEEFQLQTQFLEVLAADPSPKKARAKKRPREDGENENDPPAEVAIVSPALKKKRQRTIMNPVGLMQDRVDDFCTSHGLEFCLLALTPTELFCLVCNTLINLNKPHNIHNVSLHIIGRSQKAGISHHQKRRMSKLNLRADNAEERLELERRTGKVHCFCLKEVEMQKEADLVANEPDNIKNAVGNRSFYRCESCFFFSWPPKIGEISFPPALRRDSHLDSFIAEPLNADPLNHSHGRDHDESSRDSAPVVQLSMHGFEEESLDDATKYHLHSDDGDHHSLLRHS